MDVYTRIIELCEKRKVTLKAVETACGLSNGSIGKLRNGGKMSAERLHLIAEYFNVTVEYLLTGEKPEYYTNSEAAKLAQEILENPALHILINTAKGKQQEDILLLAEIAKKMKATNPEG